jgi:hypothetical protein
VIPWEEQVELRSRGRYHHGVIVEVQRRFGISNSIYNDTMAILNAAEGKDVPSHQMMLSSSTVNILLVVPDFEDEAESPIDGKSSLHMISTMLGYDSHFLALQTLSSLTDASKIGDSTARIASTELFRLDYDNEVGAKILSLIKTTITTGHMEGRYHTDMHHSPFQYRRLTWKFEFIPLFHVNSGMQLIDAEVGKNAVATRRCSNKCKKSVTAGTVGSSASSIFDIVDSCDPTTTASSVNEVQELTVAASCFYVFKESPFSVRISQRGIIRYDSI